MMKPATEAGNLLITVTILLVAISQHAAAKTHFLYWDLVTTNLTRACTTVNSTTVNGKFPGPTVEIFEGDTVVVNVTNKIRLQYPVTIHWHGIKQLQSNWADGTASVTQCPLKYGEFQIYEFTVKDQSGTFHWHAHIDWLRSTVYGAFIVHPRKLPPYGKVAGEFTIQFGEWYGQDTNVLEKGFQNALTPQTVIGVTLASTLNGLPGPLYNCSQGYDVLKVKKGSTYLLRLINTAMNENYHFRVTNHTLTVVAADGNYLQPFTTMDVVVAAGQTTNVLLTANEALGTYYYGISLADNNVTDPSPSIPALAMIAYEGAKLSKTPHMIGFPSPVSSIESYLGNLKNLNTVNLSKTVDQELVYVVGVTTLKCTASENCTEYNVKAAASIQNVSFQNPENASILEAYMNNVTGVYTMDLPDFPKNPSENFTLAEVDFNYFWSSRGTKVKPLKYNDEVLLVLQNVHANQEFPHPFHLHGHDFYVVGRGLGNYNATVDKSQFNFVNPPLFNTFELPNAGWVALRFQANNPGAWLLHCHFEVHQTYGMEMVFLTYNGDNPSETLPGPLHPLPLCS